MASAKASSRWTDALLDRGGVDDVNAIMRTLVLNDQPVPEELPAEIQAYLAETRPLPEWADMGKIERGQQLFETWGLQIAICLFCYLHEINEARSSGP
jgi:hypothetical protein